MGDVIMGMTSEYKQLKMTLNGNTMRLFVCQCAFVLLLLVGYITLDGGVHGEEIADVDLLALATEEAERLIENGGEEDLLGLEEKHSVMQKPICTDQPVFRRGAHKMYSNAGELVDAHIDNDLANMDEIMAIHNTKLYPVARTERGAEKDNAIEQTAMCLQTDADSKRMMNEEDHDLYGVDIPEEVTTQTIRRILPSSTVYDDEDSMMGDINDDLYEWLFERRFHAAASRHRFTHDNDLSAFAYSLHYSSYSWYELIEYWFMSAFERVWYCTTALSQHISRSTATLKQTATNRLFTLNQLLRQIYSWCIDMWWTYEEIRTLGYNLRGLSVLILGSLLFFTIYRIIAVIPGHLWTLYASCDDVTRTELSLVSVVVLGLLSYHVRMLLYLWLFLGVSMAYCFCFGHMVVEIKFK